MLECLELIGDIIAVHPFSPGELVFDAPFNAPVVSLSASQIRMAGNARSYLSYQDIADHFGFVIESYLNNVSARDSVIIELDATAKETSKTSIAGVSYDTKLSVTSYDEIDRIRAAVRRVNAYPYFDAIVVDSAYRVYLLRGVEPSTSISFSSSLPVSTKQTIDLNVVSCNGLIPVMMLPSDNGLNG